MPIAGPAQPAGWRVLHAIEQGSIVISAGDFRVLSVLAGPQRELIVANTNDGLASARARGRSAMVRAAGWPAVSMARRSRLLIARVMG
jgi:hypothetical protein